MEGGQDEGRGCGGVGRGAGGEGEGGSGGVGWEGEMMMGSQEEGEGRWYGGKTTNESVRDGHIADQC